MLSVARFEAVAYDSDSLTTTDQTSEDVLEKNNGNGSIEDSNDNILNLSGQGLTEVPEYVFGETKLTVLDLSNNNLTGSLQAEIRHLQNLTTLDLSNNEFTGVPAEIGQLQALEILNLSNNQLTGLPNELGNLSRLKELNLSGNEYSEADLANIRAKLPSTTIVIVN